MEPTYFISHHGASCKKTFYIDFGEMKRILVIFTLLFCFSQAFSQTHYDSRVSVGAHGGIDLSRVFFTPSVKQGWPVNPMLGVGIRYVEEKYFGLIAEVNYVRRGWSENFEGKPFNYRRDLDYIDIPVFAHIYFGNRFKFFLNAGPQIAFRLGESVTANFDPYDIINTPGFPLNNRRNNQLTEKVVQKIDYGISAGLGCEYSINPRNSVTLEARYYFGLGNIFSSKRQDIFRASNMMYIAINAGYWFRFK